MLSVPLVFLAIEADVRSGDIACRLVRPVSYVGAQIAEALGETAVRLAVLGPSAFLFAWLLAGRIARRSARAVARAAARRSWRAPCGCCRCGLIGLSAFWIVDTSPMYWIWQKLGFVLGGLLFPLELYPDWLRRIARLSPFPDLFWAPGRTAFGFAPGEARGAVRAGTPVGARCSRWLLFWLSRRARARLTVNGG